MKLLPFHFASKNLRCAEPGATYARAIQELAANATPTPDPLRGMFIAYWMLVFAGVAIGVVVYITGLSGSYALTMSCIDVWLIAIGVALELFNYMARAEKRLVDAAWRHNIISNPFQRACNTLWVAAQELDVAVAGWNAYVKRVEDGAEKRFDDDDRERNDINTRVLRLTSLDVSVRRLYEQHQLLVNREPPAPRSEEAAKQYQTLSALMDDLDRTDVSLIESLPTWRKQLHERQPQLAIP